MDNNDNIVMSRIAFERMQAKDERNDRWRNIIIIVLIVALLATNGAWLWVWNQYDIVADDVSIEASQEGGEVNIVGGGDVSYGTEGQDQKNNSKKSS